MADATPKKTYRWEELTSPDFAATVEEVGGVCIVPLGCVERHGDHLPLGTDVFVARKIAELAVEEEPAIIFPPHFIGWIHDGKHHPGAVALRPEILLEHLECLCEEIARNGLKKVVLLNGHGGNEPLLNYFVWKGMEKPRPFSLYCIRLQDFCFGPEDEGILETGHGHAGEGETSAVLAARPDAVRMELATPSAPSQGRLGHLPPVANTWFWYADWPDHYAGDGTLGSAGKGEKLLANAATRVARIIRAVRADEVTEQLQNEFFGRIEHG